MHNGSVTAAGTGLHASVRRCISGRGGVARRAACASNCNGMGGGGASRGRGALCQPWQAQS